MQRGSFREREGKNIKGEEYLSLSEKNSEIRQRKEKE
jgi:hypothetical protein